MKIAYGMRRHTVAMLAVIFVLGGAIAAFGQTPASVNSLRDELRIRYDIVALRDGVGLVPLRSRDDIRLIEVRNGVVAINGSTISANELRTRLGQDSDAVLRLTYLDSAALRELTGSDSASTSAAAPETRGGRIAERIREKVIAAENPESGSPEAGQEHRGDKVHIGGGVTVARGEVVDGDVVAIGGSADVDGEVTGDVTAIGGLLTLGPDAVVHGDAVAVGGAVNRSPTARVDGDVTEVGVGGLAPLGFLGRGFAARRQFSRGRGLPGTLLRITLLILMALVVVLLGGRWVETIADRAAIEPVRAGFTGLLAEVAFVPLVVLTIVVLAVSIIGIPLLLLVPFAVVLAIVLMFIGFTGVACEAGRLLSARFGIRRGPYATVALGVLAVVGTTLIARVIALGGGFVFGTVIAGPLAALGYLVEYVAWTMGIGAIILTWHHRRQAQPSTATPVSGSGPSAALAPSEN